MTKKLGITQFFFLNKFKKLKIHAKGLDLMERIVLSNLWNGIKINENCFAP